MINVKTINKKYNFEIVGASYIGKPVDNTFMFVTKKVSSLLNNLEKANNCLVFVENGIDINPGFEKKHCFVFVNSPQLAYSNFALEYSKEKEKSNRSRKYINKNNSIFGENVIIGKGTIIEPGCFIDHDVKIGDNCKIFVGNNTLINENALIGANGFNMTEDESGNKMRMPTLGKVIIGNCCEIGAFNNVSAGSGGDTVFEDNVKIDALVHIGHDVYLHKNVEITAGSVIGGFVEIDEGGYVGIHSVLRNRIKVGKKAFVGMGAVVTKSIDDGVTVVGNPAKPFERK